jgi:8-oxo-dGTP pyrophosphatase MutT (NUDIX family)
LWSGVSGYVEPGEDPLSTALKELREEVGVTAEQVQLLARCDPIVFSDDHGRKRYEWTVHPFLFRASSDVQITLDWEHTDYAWVRRSDIGRLETVPRLQDVVERLEERRMGKWRCGEERKIMR